jgi:alpha-beta hydrolase superfamily lysophospholipase
VKRRLFVLFFVLLLAGGVFLARPLAPAGLGSRPAPAANFEGSVQRARALIDADGPEIGPGCGTILLSHGRPTEHVVVLLHGLTNCPAQFDSLGRICFERGANVLIPRLPRHGLADRMTGELARSEAGELRDFTDRAIDAAQGLGGRVTVVGLSVGGTMAAWAGQHRADVAHAVIIAPLLAPPGRVPEPLARAATRLAATLPNLFVWWDDRKREALPGPQHVYPRFATRAAAASLLLGADVLAAAAAGPPGCRSAAFVTVEGDAAVGNAAIHALARAWSERGCAVTALEFPDSLKLNHDVIDPEQVGANPAVTYPALLSLIDP